MPPPRRTAPPPGFAEVTASTAPPPPPGFSMIGSVADLDKLTDQHSGSPAGVRHDVGGASTPADRLATIRQAYPDAEFYGPDNFIFTDPETGRATLYNPPGMDAGDFPSIAPELAEVAGGVVGGAAAVPPALAGAIPTAGASLLAIPAGVGLGAAGGREIENILATSLGSRIDTRDLPRRLVDTTATAGMNAVGQRVGDLAVEGAKRFIGPAVRRAFTKSTPTELLSAYENQGITPLPGAVSGSRPVQMTEHFLSYTPGGAGVMQGVTERSVGQLGERVKALAADPTQIFGGAASGRLSPQALGGLVKEGAEAAGQRFATRREALDMAIEQTIGGNSMVPVAAVQALIGKLRATQRMAPRSLDMMHGAISTLDKLVQDAAANNGTVPFAALRKIRTAIGQNLKRPDAAGYRPAEQQYLAEMYGALAEDIKAAAVAAGPAGQKALQTHDRYVRLMRTVNIPALDRIVKARTDEDAFRLLMQGSARGGTDLTRLRRSLQPNEWDEVASTVLYRLGQTKPGQQGAPVELMGEGDTFSPNTFLSRWNDLSVEAKKALFGGTRYADLGANLDQIVKITASMKDSEKMANASGSGRIMLFSALGTSMTAALVSPMAGVAAVGSTVVAPHVAARLLTSPAFTRWLAGSRMVGSNPNALINHLGRLAVVVRAEPEIREELDQYLAAIRSSPAMSGQTSAPPPAGSGAAMPGPGRL